MQNLRVASGTPDDLPSTMAGLMERALLPVRINLERDEGRYEDPNVWMQHPIAGGETD
jgi:hypothetical protein